MKLLITLELDSSEAGNGWKNLMVVEIEQRVSIKNAIAFADKYAIKEQICRLIF